MKYISNISPTGRNNPKWRQDRFKFPASKQCRSSDEESIDSRRMRGETRWPIGKAGETTGRRTEEKERFRSSGAAFACRPWGSFFFFFFLCCVPRSVRKVLPRSSGITSPSFVVAEATQQNDQEKSRWQRSSPQWQYGRPVRGPASFCPCPTGFLAHTHTHTYAHTRTYRNTYAIHISKRFYSGTRAQIPRRTYALDRLVCSFERVTGLIADSWLMFPCS